MFAMVVVAAITRLASVHTHPCKESCAHKDISQELSFHDSSADYLDMFLPYCETKIRKRDYGRNLEARVIDQSKDKEATDATEVEDREDHVTQHLAELLVNTEQEITGLQVNDNEERVYEPDNNEDRSFVFLTGQEKNLEVEGAWSRSEEVSKR